MSDPRQPASERDPALDAAWRAHSTELPPPTIDAALRAAAYREAGARPRRLGDEDDTLAEAREPARWWWGLAAAATIGAIAFGIVQLAPPPVDPMVASDIPRTEEKRQDGIAAAPPQQSTEKTVDATKTTPTPEAAPAKPAPQQRPQAGPGALTTPQRDATVPMPRSAPPPAPAAPPITPPAPPPTPAIVQPETRARQKLEAQTAPAEPDRAAAASAPRPFPATPSDAAVESFAPAPPAAADRSDESRARDMRAPAPPPAMAKRRDEPGTVAGSVAPAPPAISGLAAPAPKAAERAAAVRSADEWIERVGDLYDARRFDEAARELNAFRAAYADADARLPERLRGWAASVPKPR